MMHTSFRSSVSLLAAVVLVGCAEPSCEVISSGQFRALSEPKKSVAPETTTGTRQTLKMEIIKETERVAINRDQGFGFEYTLKNVHPDAQLTAEVVHPKMENHKGEMSTGFRSRWSGRNKVIAYWFSEEKLPPHGLWTLKIEYKAKTLCERTYYLEPPDDA
jgi:hypothetical protein